MFKIFRKELDWNGTPLVLETGKVARQADGAVMVSLGETTVLCTAVAAHSPKPGQDFFPLTVNYQEKAFAAGKIPGGFFKREGRPSENETLVSRLIDRPIRPLFPSSFKCETQVICTVLAHDMENNPDIAAMIGASAALCLSGVPFFGPIAAARVGWIDGEYVLNPTVAQMDETALDLVLAGTHEGVLMVESEAQELSEEVMLGAVTFGHDAMKPVIDAIIDLAESCAKEPRAHGSSLFTRGETQAMVVATLGTGQDEQIIDALVGESRSNFMLHYNFPPYSVGEAGRVGSPGRREIGHGKLAWRALRPLLPKKEDFPYTIRLVSEITESNGSSSMATVCGGSLALMDAGVPLDRPVAGIAMGLIKEGDSFAVLSDILGDEDHLGDMDFKVAGSEAGVTSLQMDIKITSITPEIMQIALDQAKDGRLHILGEMAKALTSARDGLADSAPKITTMSIPVDKIRDIIGPGGKIIREICETTGAKIDIDDDGTVKVAAVTGASGEAAVARIKDIVAEPELGVIYNGKVVKTVDFGAFVNFLGAKDGLVHISELQNGRTEKTTDICKEGDMVKVKVIGFDDRGKVKLSMKRVDQETGADLEAEEAE